VHLLDLPQLALRSRKEIVRRRVAIGCVLTFAALLLMTSPALAVPGSPQVAPVLSAADQEFLASLASPDAVPAHAGVDVLRECYI
jgi:hypothetical protein